MDNSNSNTPAPIKLRQVLTTIFILIGAICLCILGIYEKQGLLILIACFSLAIIYAYATVKNINAYIMYKKSNHKK